MLYFKQTILSQIKSAVDETEVEDVITSSIERLKFKSINGHIIQRYIAGMRTTLHQEKLLQQSFKEIRNMDFAIHVFTKLHKQ
jgi:hypothetical protein